MTAGIGEALQRSAASFNAANTSLEGAISVITTANSVVQNPEAVGTAMKTLSARIRGSKVELEELGEEEEDVLNLTSKLRAEVKAMTGFDIMEDEETYKSIDEIIIGIGKHWKELTDIQQAALAEDLAGKRNSNVLIALLQNAELVEQVYDKATHAAGSAAKEQQNYMMSIQYSLDRFTASMQELEADLVDSQLVKDIVDIGTVIVNILDEIVEHIGLLGAGASIAGIVALVKNFKELKATFEAMQTITKTAKLLDIADTDKKAEALETVIGATKTLTKAQAEEVLTIAGVSAATKKDVLAKAGLAGANATATVSVEALTASLWANVKAMAAFLVGTPVGWAILAAAAIAGTVAAFDALTTSVEESKKKVDEYSDSINKIKSELEELRNLEKKTASDNKRIAYLEKELKLQERLLEIEQQRYYRNLTEDTFANWFDKDNISAQQEENIRREINGGGTARYITDLERQVGKLQKLDGDIYELENSAGNHDEELTKLQKKREDALSKGDAFYEDLLNEYETYVKQEAQLTEALDAKNSSGFHMLTGKARKDAKAELSYAHYEIKQITETLREFEKLKGEYNPFNITTGIVSDDLFNESEIKNAVNSTDDLYSAQARLMAQFPSLDGLCSKYGLTVKELVEYYWEQKEAVEAVTDAEAKRAGTLSTAVSNMNSRILPQFEELGKVYDKIFNGDKDFDLSHISGEDLEGLRSAFEDLDEDLNIDWESKTEDVDKFLSVIGNSSSTATEVHKAFDDIATSYFNAAVAAGDFTEENAKVLEQILTEKGVVNAGEVVDYYTNLASAQKLAAENGFDLANATAATIDEFVAEIGATEETANALYILALKQIFLNKNWVDEETSVEHVLSLAKAAGIASNALTELANIQARIAEAKLVVQTSTNIEQVRGAQKTIDYLNQQSKDLATQVEQDIANVNVDVSFSVPKSGKGSAGGAGKEAADEYVKQFEEALQKLKDSYDNGKVMPL